MGDATSQPKRPVRIANCSGARGDPAYQMLRQATMGPVDFITGDYLAEMTLAENIEQMKAGKHEGWEVTAWAGLEASLVEIAKRGIKVAINGGAQNPRGLAQKVQQFSNEHSLNLTVAHVWGDGLLEEVKAGLAQGKLPNHLDAENSSVTKAHNVEDLMDTENKPILSANAYLGARAIVKALEMGADIVICGRVADASPPIAVAWWWHGWKETDYNQLAHSLVAGHLIECSSYIAGANFSCFDEFPLETFLDLSFGIAEIAHDGTSIITKHEGTNGLINEDTTRHQFLYELQGNIYLNSDVTADTTNIKIEEVGRNRVRMSGIKGHAPPPTTKLAIVYHGGYECQIVSNATGYATDEKWALFETQFRGDIARKGLTEKFQLLDFQVLGVAAADPRTQFSSTTHGRWFIQADAEATVAQAFKAWIELAMQHFSGFHFAVDFRTAMPRPYQAYYPGTISQDELKEGATILGGDGSDAKSEECSRPAKYEKLAPRQSYETASAVDLKSFGRTKRARLGDVVWGRSGDKGANINCGLFVRDASHYPWLQSFMTAARLQELMAEDWREEYFVERVEFQNILAVHFVIYGPLGRGVSGCRLLDSLGKGFVDFIRDRVVDVPVKFLRDVEAVRVKRRAVLAGEEVPIRVAT